MADDEKQDPSTDKPDPKPDAKPTDPPKPDSDAKSDPKPDPAKDDDKTDWKSEARKWETRAKENKGKLDELEPLAKQAREAEEAKKTEMQRLQDRAEKAEKERDSHASTATRLQVAMEKGLTPSQAKRLVGSTREELEADADELIADLKPEDKRPGAKDVIPGRPDDGQKSSGDDKPDPKRVAREALTRNR
jgi:hypothetical protein